MSSNTSPLAGSAFCGGRRNCNSISHRSIAIINCHRFEYPPSVRVVSRKRSSEVERPCAAYFGICKNRTRLRFFTGSTWNLCRVQSREGAGWTPGHGQPKRLEVLADGSPSTDQAQQLDELWLEEARQLDDRSLSSWGADVSDEKKISKEGNRHHQNGHTVSSTSDDVSRVDDGEKEEETSQEHQDEVEDEDTDEEIEYVTTISVPRQKYIHVPKVDLINALLLLYFPANKDASKFISLCSYLELILHAEHKVVLEELRSDYTLTQSVDQDGNMLASSRVMTSSPEMNTLRLGGTGAEKHDQVASESPQEMVDSQSEGKTRNKRFPWKIVADVGIKVMAAFKQEHKKVGDSADAVDGEAREAAAKRFQKNFLKMLRDAEFEGISVRDLELTAALNSDYLLTLPVDVDWKRAASSNVIILRRGYTKEEQKGLLLGEKLDYLQSLLLRKIFRGFTGPLLYAGRWCLEKWKSLWKDAEGRALAESVSRWLQEPLQTENQEITTQSSNMKIGVPDKETELDLPVWMAAHQTIPRYEAVLTSAGSRGKLLRGMLVRMGLLQPESFPLNLPNAEDENALEPHLRPNHLSRVSMKDIWLPASTGVVGRNIWRRLGAAFSVFFSKATLQEPAFQELVLLYNGDGQGDSEETGLQLQTYKKIPLPDLKMVFPSKRLIYRVLDTVRLDITSLAGLLAFTVNYRFDDLSSPSAFVLDIIATSALVVFITRAGFGYKQVWDRYQLLVNKTLYEKTVASGFGVVHFLLDQSEEQQFKEAILVFMLLMHQGKPEGMTTAQLGDACERFLYYRCKAQVEMPIERAIDTLVKLGLIMGSKVSSEVRFRALPYEDGLRALEQHWVSLPSSMPLSN